MNSEQAALQKIERIPDEDWARRLTAAVLPDRGSLNATRLSRGLVAALRGEDPDVIRRVYNRPEWRASSHGWAFSEPEARS